MINLSNAKIGDWYGESPSFGDVKLIALGTEEACFLFEDNTRFLVTDLRGRNHDGIPVVVSKIDQRPWLKDMPDAGIFVDGVNWLACDADGLWYTSAGEPELKASEWGESGYFSGLRVVKMPTLTGDQWKYSKISIEELREWQGVNK
tara:strand:- start:36 stop:476 length:441 start_codon:yes stop_codon:yes gene_type:complete